MGDETKQVVVSEELRHKIEVSNLKIGKAQAELVGAQQAVTLAQQALQAAQQSATALQARVDSEILDHGAWEVVHDDGSGNITLKLTEAGKTRRDEAAKAANGASETPST